MTTNTQSLYGGFHRALAKVNSAVMRKRKLLMSPCETMDDYLAQQRELERLDKEIAAAWDEAGDEADAAFHQVESALGYAKK